jgi:protein-disulfide isomerase
VPKKGTRALISTRREFLNHCGAFALILGAGALIGGGVGVLPAWAQAHDHSQDNAEETKSVAIEELMNPGPLPDQFIGSPDAPVTIIEYASLTCSHCAHFATTTFPDLKTRYIDTGKVRFVLREFPLDALAAAAFMLARCAGEGKYFPVAETLFQKQREWTVRDPIKPLMALTQQAAGLDEKSFHACLQNRELLAQLQEGYKRAATKFGVNSTPTFFINGTAHRGSLSIDEMTSLVEAELKKG